MRGRFLGALLLLGSQLVLACGPTHTNGPGGGSGGTSAQAGSDPLGQAGQGATAHGGGNTAGAGGASLPPDGVIPPAQVLHKLDLLLMVDNSRNTAEKQRLLADAVRSLLAAPAFSADDVHVGVITSSLGAHGATGARDVCVSVEDDDHAHLLGSLRPGLVSFQNLGFLAWGPEAGSSASLEALATDLSSQFLTVGDKGCGYEASLEAWYRFLVDPEPPLSIVLPAGGSSAQVSGVDDTLLAQRKAFLRPDSVLAIVVMSDENDCSIRDEGYGWLISRAAPMYRGTSACLANPNDPCCQSCGEQTANPGCPAIASDPECGKGQTLTGSGEDDLNLRCWEQKRRFGFDLLYPIGRYTDALTRQATFNHSGVPVPNPLFVQGVLRRHPSQIIYTGIVGVPWQDVADAASLTGAGLTLLSGAELSQQKRWAMMIGDPSASPPVPPSDPFMLEMPGDRAALSSVSAHPIVLDAKLVPSDSLDPQANPINGHESNNQGNRSLQHVCTFPLATALICDQAAFDADQSCLCFAEDAVYNNAICQPPGGGPAGTTQYYADAFPGLRHLQLQQSLGDTAITASVCPKVLDEAVADYGYRPVMKALGARIERALQAQ